MIFLPNCKYGPKMMNKTFGHSKLIPKVRRWSSAHLLTRHWANLVVFSSLSSKSPARVLIWSLKKSISYTPTTASACESTARFMGTNYLAFFDPLRFWCQLIQFSRWTHASRVQGVCSQNTYQLSLVLFALANIAERRVWPNVYVIV